MATAVEGAIDVAADAAEVVSEEAAETALALRGWNAKEGGLFLLGAGLGLVGGIAVGYGVAGKRLRTKYEELADQEILGMKEHYDRKLRALENQTEKKTLDDKLKAEMTKLIADFKERFVGEREMAAARA